MWLKNTLAPGTVHLRTPKDLAELAQSTYATAERQRNECKHFQISINYVNTIPRRKSTSTTVTDTRQIHAVRNMGSSGRIAVKNIGCLCNNCIMGYDSCANPEYWLPWRLENVGLRPGPLKTSMWPLSESTVEEALHCVTVPGSQESVPEVKSEDMVIDHSIKEDSSAKVNCTLPQSALEWKRMLRCMNRCSTYSDLKQYCSAHLLPPLPAKFAGVFHPGIDSVDENAAKILIDGNVTTERIPCSTVGDGACLVRAISKVIFDTEQEHIQIRVRLIDHALKCDNAFLDNSNLRRGCHEGCTRFNFTDRFSTYSEYYNPSRRINAGYIKELWEQEWLGYTAHDAWSGIYQLFCAADLLNVELKSYYCNDIIASVYQDLNRSMFPLGREPASEAIHIMWTSLDGKRSRTDHFVPLLEKEV